ncbi:acyl-CoA dehydrogenase family protein [Solibacillus sp. FSL R7-0668]|uniref:acyl-CoA dehydrogenase family protein n=1 Tax=Solibacillus sp. FSL R7-0668 TaxID=2921688 RepID=UPI0030F9E604
MEMATKVQDYSFKQFLKLRNSLNDWDNPFLQKLFQQLLQQDYEQFATDLEPYIKRLSTTWRNTTNEIARPENAPTIRHYNAYNERIDRIVRPLEAIQLTEEIFNDGLFSAHQQPYKGIVKRYFLHGNGETGITCPLACTDGLIALIEMFYDEVPQAVRDIYEHAKNGRNGQFAIGAQFMSEIQGGSNIPANVLRAVAHDDHYLLYGNKFFCSAVHADYSVVTARIEGTEDIAVFVVPTWLPGDKELERRNHHTVNRLKWKLGTSELPSGEIDYNGAVAYRIGPQNRGVALAVSIVLTRSRLDIGFSSAAFVMRAAREAMLYARFRQVFDRKIDEFPMAAAQLEDLQDAAKRMAATAFTIYERFLQTDNEDAVQAFATREIILLQKIFASKEAVEKLRLAISIFGGHGAIEDFSSIPRLFRDSMVNELWEGPRNVLLAQIYRDLHKITKTISLQRILQAMFPNVSLEQLQAAQQELQSIMQIDLTAMPTKENRQAARRWEQVWEALFLTYQQNIVENLEETSILPDQLLAQI